MRILTLNAGSSSLKFAVFENRANDLTELTRGTVEQSSPDGHRLRIATADGPMESQSMRNIHHLSESLETVWSLLEKNGFTDINAVGHRIVHGGSKYQDPVLIDSDVLDNLQSLSRFAPLHQPAQLEFIRDILERRPHVIQATCFDTAFHATIPEIAARYPLPEKYWNDGIRKYGFHGLSCESLLNSFEESKQGKTIIAHLGNGCSITAIQDGRSIDTTMGMTPTGGVMMGTRAGDLDPGVLVHLLRADGMSIEEFEQMMNRESGLLGVSGLSNSAKVLLDARENPEAQRALDMFCYRVAKAIGEMFVVLNGLSRLIFTGGIGERSAEIRSRICRRLSALNIQIDETANGQHESRINCRDSEIAIHVIPTREENVIAKHVSRLLFDSGTRNL